jgi:hypothetical protein
MQTEAGRKAESARNSESEQGRRVAGRRQRHAGRRRPMQAVRSSQRRVGRVRNGEHVEARIRQRQAGRRRQEGR